MRIARLLARLIEPRARLLALLACLIDSLLRVDELRIRGSHFRFGARELPLRFAYARLFSRLLGLRLLLLLLLPPELLLSFLLGSTGLVLLPLLLLLALELRLLLRLLLLLDCLVALEFCLLSRLILPLLGLLALELRPLARLGLLALVLPPAVFGVLPLLFLLSSALFLRPALGVRLRGCR